LNSKLKRKGLQKPAQEAMASKAASRRGVKTPAFKTKTPELRGVETRGAKTRARILSTCRTLFNERGLANVTTADIANAVGINEGNLYYHFQRKEQLIENLFDEFEASLQQVAAGYLTYGGDSSRYADYLVGWFSLMWEWRFFYRDGVAVYQLAPTLRGRVKALSDFGQDQIRRAMRGMIRAGLLRASAEEIESLIVNSWIVATYWIDYLRSRHGVTRIKREHIEWGARQASSLFAPYLTPLGSDLMTRRAAASRYDESVAAQTAE
jgi:AcrR family transcriptional regulator